MKCKSCGREVPDNSFFCNWCGQKIGKAPKKESDIKIPEPEKHGTQWRIRLRKEGITIVEETPEKCRVKARAARAGFIQEQKNAPKLTVKTCIDRYLKDNQNVLSPATMRGYLSYQKTHFTNIEKEDVTAVAWQRFVNELSAERSAKSVMNVWRLATAAMRYSDITPPKVNLPKVAVADEPFLDFQQIQIFLKAVYGQPVELAALLGLHSLRRSEILALTPENIDRKNNIIHVRGSRVVGTDNRLVAKSTNKTKASTRDVPIMIPRLLELIPETGTEYLITGHQNRIMEKINTVCRHSGLPEVGVHGLRRSFASLAYHLKWDERTTMLIGGWSNIQTIHKYYIKLSSTDISKQTDSMKEFFTSIEV